MAGEVGAESVALAVGLDLDGLDVGEVAHEVGPGDVDVLLVQPTLEIDLEPEREEARDDVADRVPVGVVMDRADIEDRPFRGSSRFERLPRFSA